MSTKDKFIQIRVTESYKKDLLKKIEPINIGLSTFCVLAINEKIKRDKLL
jgi:hypothetical protein